MKSAIEGVLAINPRKSLGAYVESCFCLLKNIIDRGVVSEGTAMHGHLIKMGISSERFIAVKLLTMYLNCARFREAHEIVKEFDRFDLVVHNCLISANVKWGNLDGARRLFEQMPERNEVSWTALISGFMKYGRVEESLGYFERNPFQNVISWTAAISGFLQNGFDVEALKLFLKMRQSGVKPNDVTFTSVIRACTGSGKFCLGMVVVGLIIKDGFEHNLSVSNSLITLTLRMGEVVLARRIFDGMVKRDVVSWTAILDMYVEIGDLGEARRIFNEMPVRNEVSWSAMIARYSQSGYPKEALKLFYQMVRQGYKANISCFPTVLSALACLKNLRAGTNIHGLALKIGIVEYVFVSTSLIDFYCKCGKTRDGRFLFDSNSEKSVASWNSMIGGHCLNGPMEDAEVLFDNMPVRNNVSWNTMMLGYAENKQFGKVFQAFNEMLLSEEIPDRSTFATLLCACASTASLYKGQILHGKTIKVGIHHDIFVGTALTNMYVKSGDIQSAMRSSTECPRKTKSLGP